MAERCVELLGRDTSELRIVTLQLGSGCSAAAVAYGKSVETSMGFTPLEGLMMGTRSGQVDPALPGYLARVEGVTIEKVEGWLNNESGLLGVSGRTADMSTLLDLEAEGDHDASLAVEMFCHRVRLFVGGYLNVLGGADAIVFGGRHTGGTFSDGHTRQKSTKLKCHLLKS